MALPSETATHLDYFNRSLKFLQEYWWLYNIPNTHILVNKIFDRFPTDWIEYFKQVPTAQIFNPCEDTPSIPATLESFFATLNALKPKYTPYKNNAITLTNTRHLNPKKIHEITNLAPIIGAECSKLGVSYIIDIGAGLGYLPQLLHEKYGYKVMGIEGNKKYVEQAVKIQNEMYSSSKNLVHYVNHFVTDSSANEIKNIFLRCFNNFDPNKDKVCIVALHACADLTIHIINIFNQIAFANHSVIMPCCYHRIEGTDSQFRHFPLSTMLKEVYGKFSDEFLTRPFLRLACQQSGVVWETMNRDGHNIQAKNCLFRNILQEVVEEDKIKIARQKRKTGGKSSEYTIDLFVASLASSYNFFWINSGEPVCSREQEAISSKIVDRYLHVYRDSECLIEAFTALQASLQSICENVVLLDRCAYMEHLGLQCRTEKVMDERISPRCYAFLVAKEL